MPIQPLKGSVEVTAQNLINNEPNNNIGFYFDIIQEHSISIQNQITDNYLENNTSVQDHIAQSPIVINLRGISGEVVFTPPTNYFNKIKDTIDDKIPFASKLAPLSQLLPQVDNYTQAARDLVQLVETNTERVKKIAKTFTSEFDKKDRLESIYDKLMLLRTNNTALRVETPFKVYDNMFIQSLTLRQGDLKYSGDIEMNLKQINYANVEVTKPNEEVMAKYNAYARAQEANNGKAQGVNVNNSIIYGRYH